MKKYTLGFIFTSDYKEVLLIHKSKPDWQRGRINGLGGKVEKDESFIACISREVREESGLSISESDWVSIGYLESAAYFAEVFASVYQGKSSDATSVEEQLIEWFPTDKLPGNVMSNLTWLIPLSVDKLKHHEPKTVKVHY